MSPMNLNKVFNSVRKTNNLLVLDTSTSICSLSSEILSQTLRSCFNYLKSKPEILALPHVPQPTSFGLTKNFYNDYAKMLGYEEAAIRIQNFFLSGDKEAAARAVPDQLVDETALVGSPAHIREQLAKWKTASARNEVGTMIVSAKSPDEVRFLAQELL